MIRLENLDRIFQVGDETVRGLDQVSLEINRGDYLAIMGPSGSGKSTLLNILGLLDQPDSGTYWLDDVNTTLLNSRQLAELRSHRIGFVFQTFHLVPRMTAAENIELPMILSGVERAERRQRVQQALQELDLSDRASHRPDQLSGGQRQRVAIARATIMQPEILLADEPTGNLDRHSGQEVIKTLEAMNRDGITLLLVTHDPELGKRARRLVRMVDGAIVEDRNNAD